MILDLRTICIVSGLSCILLACVQPVGFSAAGAERWPIRWSLSNISVGVGLLLSSLQGIAPNFVSIVVANSLTLLGYFLLLATVRAFAGRDVSWRAGAFVIAVTVALSQFAWDDLSDYRYRIAFFSVQAACYDALIIREGVRLARSERLVSAWTLVSLFALTSMMFIVRAILALSGGLGGQVMFSATDAGPNLWLAAVGGVILNLRGITLLQMATERSRNLLLAQAQHDPLTGAMNRGGLETSVAQLAARRPWSSARIALLLIDIDHFKLLNDTAGHSAGDAVLRLFASTAKIQLRNGDTLTRLGGDEFVAVLPGAGLDEAVRVAEQIRQAFAAAVSGLSDLADLQTQPTLSIGIADGDVVSDRLEAILKAADEALYRSKRQGRNRVEAMTGVLWSRRG